MGIAHELITRGWTQGVSETGSNGEVCIVGAAAAAFGTLTGDYLSCWFSIPENVREALYDVLPQEWWEPAFRVRARREGIPAPVWSWNDSAGRTFDEVLRVAKEADAQLGL